MASCINCTLNDIVITSKSYVFIVFAIGVLCALLNTLVLLIFLTHKKLRQNPYHFLVLLLSVCDLLVGVGFIIYTIRTLHAEWINSKFLCILQTVLLTNGIFLSLFQTFLISLQRYLVICRTSLSNLLFQNKRKYFVCLFNWMVIFVFTVGLVSPPEKNPQGLCSTDYVYYKHYGVLKVFIRSTILFIVMTVVLYCITIRHVIKINRKIVPKNHAECVKEGTSNTRQVSMATLNVGELKTVFGSNVTSPRTELTGIGAQPVLKTSKKSIQTHPMIITEHRKITGCRRKKVMNTIVLVGILMVSLVFLSGPLIMSLVVPQAPSVYLTIAAGLCSINSVVNPFIYCWKLSDLRDALIKCFRKVFCC